MVDKSDAAYFLPLHHRRKRLWMGEQMIAIKNAIRAGNRKGLMIAAKATIKSRRSTKKEICAALLFMWYLQYKRDELLCR
jgi:hypothetical protein